MTLNDLLKRVKKEDYDKVIIFNNGKGWTNVNVSINNVNIVLSDDRNEIFSDDKM